MRLLLDTHILVWAVSEPEKLPTGLGGRLVNDDDEKLFSAVSVWEVAIKFALKRPHFTLRPEAFLSLLEEAGFLEVPVTSAATCRVGTLPLHHRDPFDRLLVAQAIEEDAVLLTADAALSAYAPHVLMLS